MGILLKKEVSMLNRPGPRNVLRPTFPKVPAIGTLKARGSNQWSTVPKITGPLKSGFLSGTSTGFVSPVPELLKPITGERTFASKHTMHKRKQVRILGLFPAIQPSFGPGFALSLHQHAL